MHTETKLKTSLLACRLLAKIVLELLYFFEGREEDQEREKRKAVWDLVGARGISFNFFFLYEFFFNLNGDGNCPGVEALPSTERHLWRTQCLFLFLKI